VELVHSFADREIDDSYGTTLRFAPGQCLLRAVVTLGSQEVVLVQYSLHMSDGQTVVISPEDFSKINDPEVRLCPVLRRNSRDAADSTVWINPAHVVWVTRAETRQ
jgi:hypothetical protein